VKDGRSETSGGVKRRPHTAKGNNQPLLLVASLIVDPALDKANLESGGAGLFAAGSAILFLALIMLCAGCIGGIRC